MRKLCILVLLLFVGCNRTGEPTLDCSSEAAYHASMKRITASMTPEDAKFFERAMKIESVSGMLKHGLAGAALGPHEKAKHLNGLTGKQIMAKLRETLDEE